MRFAIRFAKANDQEIIVQYAEDPEREFTILKLSDGPILQAYNKRAQGSHLVEHNLISREYSLVIKMVSMIEENSTATESLLDLAHSVLRNLSFSVIPFSADGDMLGAEVYIHDMLISDSWPIWTDHIESVRVLLYDTERP